MMSNLVMNTIPMRWQHYSKSTSVTFLTPYSPATSIMLILPPEVSMVYIHTPKQFKFCFVVPFNSLCTKQYVELFVELANLDQRLLAYKYLIALLPPANRDTFWLLIRFLNLVSQHSKDTVDSTGQLVSILPNNQNTNFCSVISFLAHL